MTRSRTHTSWGLLPPARHDTVSLAWRHAPLPEDGPSLLPYGLGRSYGDSCLNDGGALLLTRGLDRFIAFDEAQGVLRCEAGVSLAEILSLAVPKGWMLPVTPGTRNVTVGGAIANDVHGKNHHREGTFGRHVRAFELLRSDGSRHLCSPVENQDLFGATIGGLGLTGLVTWAELQLRRIESPLIDHETVKFGGLSEFFELNTRSEQDFEYTVAWIDCHATGNALGRGHYLRGNHAPRSGNMVQPRDGMKLAVPFALPSFVLNPLTVRLFNFAYYHRQRARLSRRRVAFDPFFYPLDAVQRWNLVYGRAGFFQYQCVLPPADSPHLVRELLTRIARSKEASFLVVLKTFGAMESPGWMSFPRPGVTLAVDFRNRGEETLRLFRSLDEVVNEAGGALYPAKDARMRGEDFRRAFPRWEEFSKQVDPRFSSSFWRRVTDGGDT